MVDVADILIPGFIVLSIDCCVACGNVDGTAVVTAADEVCLVTDVLVTVHV